MAGGNITIKVTTQELINKSASIQTKVKSIKSKFDEMQRIVDQSKNYWEGEAAEIHRSDYQEYWDEIFEITARLEEHVKDLNQMAGVYEQAEQSVKSVIEELPNDVIV